MKSCAGCDLVSDEVTVYRLGYPIVKIPLCDICASSAMGSYVEYPNQHGENGRIYQDSVIHTRWILTAITMLSEQIAGSRSNAITINDIQSVAFPVDNEPEEEDDEESK